MTPTSAPRPSPNKNGTRPLLARIVPAFAAITLVWSGMNAHATVAQGQAAINAKLIAFATDRQEDPDQNNDNKPGVTATTNATAKAAELILAIFAAMEDPANAGISASDFVAGALTPDLLGKKRGDADKVIAQILDQAIQSRKLAGDKVQIAAMIKQASLVIIGTGPALSVKGLTAAIGQGLKSATDASTGEEIATQLESKIEGPAVVDKTKTVAAAVQAAVTGTGANVTSVKSFIDRLFDQGTLTAATPADRTQAAIAVAKLIKKAPAAVGEIMAGAAVDLTSQNAVRDVAVAALANTAVAAAAADVVASLGTKFLSLGGGGDAQTFANALGNDPANPKNEKTKSGIAAGAIKVSTTSVQATAIFNALRTDINGVNLLGAKLITFAANASIGNDEQKVGAITTAAAALVAGADKTKLGAAIIATISATNPGAAAAVGKAIIDSDTINAFDTVEEKSALAGSLAKAAKTSTAAGAAAAGVASKLAVGDVTGREKIANFAILAAAKSVSTISMEIGKQLGTSADRITFAGNVAFANPTKASEIAVGVSMADAKQSDQIVDRIIGIEKVKTAAAKVVAAVAMAVDVEEIAEIVTMVSTHFTLDGKGGTNLKASTATAIAAAAAKAINSKPGINTANRADELGEVAASMIGQLALNTTVDSLGKTIDIGTKVKLISGIAQSVIKALSKNETVEVKNEAADLTFAAGIAGDIAFTLFRAKTQGLITAGDFDLIKAKLLLDIPKLGGAGYGPFKVGTVLQPGAILTAMNDAFAGTSPLNKYEDGTRPGDTTVNPDIPAYPKAYPSTLLPGTKTGSVIDPETDSRNG